MLHKVKKAERLERTIDGIMSQYEDFYDLFLELLKERFKDSSEQELMEWWNLPEDMDYL
jgi:hypothetical protein